MLHNSTIIPLKLYFICIPKQKLFAILFLSILHNTKQPLWRQLGVSSVLIGRSNTCLRYKFKLFDREVYPYMIINKTLILPIINVNNLYIIRVVVLPNLYAQNTFFRSNGTWWCKNTLSWMITKTHCNKSSLRFLFMRVSRWVTTIHVNRCIICRWLKFAMCKFYYLISTLPSLPFINPINFKQKI